LDHLRIALGPALMALKDPHPWQVTMDDMGSGAAWDARRLPPWPLQLRCLGDPFGDPMGMSWGWEFEWINVDYYGLMDYWDVDG